MIPEQGAPRRTRMFYFRIVIGLPLHLAKKVSGLLATPIMSAERGQQASRGIGIETGFLEVGFGMQVATSHYYLALLYILAAWSSNSMYYYHN